MLKNIILLFMLNTATASFAQTDVAYKYDPENGEEINELCAGCHGEYGEGGGGEYPRLADMPARYLINQLQAFQTGIRKSRKMEKHIMSLTSGEIEALLAYLSLQDD